MKVMLNPSIVSLVLVTGIWAQTVFAQASDRPNQEELTVWTANINVARTYWALQRGFVGTSSVPQSAKEKHTEFRTFVSRLRGGGRDVFNCLVDRMDVILQQRSDRTGQQVDQSLNATTTERLLWRIEVLKEKGDLKDEYVKEIIRIIPVTQFSLSIGGREVTFSGRPGKGAIIPEIPAIDAKKQRAIAVTLAEAGEYDLAWRCCAEATYAEGDAPWTTTDVSTDDNSTWLSPRLAKHWIQVAEFARLARNQEMGWSFLNKAAVFGTNEQFLEAQKVAKRWISEGAVATQPILDPVDKRKNLTSAIGLLSELNLQPRALALLEKDKTDFANPGKLRKDLEDQWTKQVTLLAAVAKEVRLYGQVLVPNEGRIKSLVKIPWPFRQIELKENVKDGDPARTSTTRPEKVSNSYRPLGQGEK